MSTRSQLGLARRIASRLMTNGKGQRAERLQLRGPNEEDFGGWCIGAVISQIRCELDPAFEKRYYQRRKGAA